MWEDPEELGWLYSMYAFGVLPKKRLVVSPDVNERGLSCFYGRQALNVDAIRKIMADLPGVSGDDFERDLMGSVRPDAPQYKGSYRRLPVIMLKAPVTVVRMNGRIRRAHDKIRDLWLDEVVDGKSSESPLDRLIAGRELFQWAFSLHCVRRFMFQGAMSALTGAAEKAGDPGLITQLLSGVGDVNETRMADDLWRLGQGQISEDEFLREWGYHGPNEGNLYTTVWRENPGPIRQMAAASARRDGRPRDRAELAHNTGIEAERTLLAATPALQRPVLRWLLRRTRNIVRTIQIGKTGYLMALDVARAAARAFGAEQAALGRLQNPDDVFFLGIDECQALERGELPNVQEIVDVRQATREEYKAMVLPVAFTGMPEPIVVEPDLDSARLAEFSGAAGGGGRVEGWARVVVDPGEDVDLEEGDILVCRFTDPSWTPLMSLASALVIDIGGTASHGAVVARELNIPYVIGTEVGSRAIRDGDRILVDGDQNVVRVLERKASDVSKVSTA
ncbi:PEP-utilizing enzyme [Gordonia jinghuaiqii]|uniref:PEP-utilizing enzyme n=1 Tax=Gordonia jinghuaiqii TaxID=2758710 RepID=UPI002948BBDA|nr:PEP-utilizing enzyme [Gordonia jinghuaiqii]